MKDWGEILQRYCDHVMKSEGKPDQILLGFKQYERGLEAERLGLNYSQFWSYVHTGKLPIGPGVLSDS